MQYRKRFGRLPEGENVFRYDLINHNGIRASVLSYGATLMELHVPDAEGSVDDVVLGYEALDSYIASTDDVGCVVGRVAGRITEGRFEAEGAEFALVTNDPPHHLNGGLLGFGKRCWREVSADERHVCLEYTSPDGEEGYPGTVTARTTYRLTEADELSIEFQARTDRATPLTLSPHVYFNLGGVGEGRIGDHRLCVFAQEVVGMTHRLTLTGELLPVRGKPFDLNHGARIGDVLPRLREHHGDLYRIRRTRRGDLVPAARLEHPPTGRVVHVATTQDLLQFDAGCRLTGEEPGKGGRPLERHAGVCLNPQGYPNGASRGPLGDIVLKPGQTYRHHTVYAFGARRD